VLLFFAPRIVIVLFCIHRVLLPFCGEQKLLKIKTIRGGVLCATSRM